MLKLFVLLFNTQTIKTLLKLFFFLLINYTQKYFFFSLVSQGLGIKWVGSGVAQAVFANPLPSPAVQLNSKQPSTRHPSALRLCVLSSHDISTLHKLMLLVKSVGLVQ